MALQEYETSYVDGLIAELEAAHTRITEQSETIADMDVEYGELQDKLEAAEKRLKNTEWHLANEANLHAEMATKLELAEKMATTFEDEMGEVHLKLEAAVRELNVSESAYASACERADDYHAANLVLINKLGAAEQRLKIMQGEFDLLKQENKDLFRIAADRTRELEAAEARIRDQSISIDNLRNDLAKNLKEQN